jgi:hypothetical protein
MNVLFRNSSVTLKHISNNTNYRKDLFDTAKYSMLYEYLHVERICCHLNIYQIIQMTKKTYSTPGNTVCCTFRMNFCHFAQLLVF